MALDGLTDEVVERVYAELVSEGYFDIFKDDPKNLLGNSYHSNGLKEIADNKCSLIKSEDHFKA